MKKIIRCVIVLLYLMLCGCLVRADDCTHKNTYSKVIEESTCMEEGRQEIICADCGKKLSEEVIPETDHAFMDCYCSVCGTYTWIDNDSRTIILTRKLYNQMEGYDPYNVVIPEEYYSVDGSECDGYTIVGLAGSLFQNNTDIVSVSMADTVTHIHLSCFYGCSALETVNFSDNITEIGQGAFQGCTSLKSVVLPSSLKQLGSYCFDGCSGLISVDMPEGLESIGTAAFQMCSSLEFISLPDSVTYIGNFAFNHCTSIKNTVIELPDSLELIGDGKYLTHVFYDCGLDDTFSDFSILENNQYYKTIDGILYTKDGSMLISIPRGKKFNDGTYVMPDTVTTLGELSFSRNKNINTVVISDNLIISDEWPSDAKKVFLNSGTNLSIACYGYSGVSRYEVKDTNENYISVDGILYSKDGKTMVAVPSKYQGEIVIPDGTERISSNVIWENGVQSFRGICFNELTGFNFPASLVEIPDTQIDAINNIAKYYGIGIYVSQNNPAYCVVNGSLMVTE